MDDIERRVDKLEKQQTATETLPVIIYGPDKPVAERPAGASVVVCLPDNGRDYHPKRDS